MSLTLERISLAKRKLSEVVRRTDLIHAPSLSADSDVYLKAENLQVTGSFKVRGAAFKVANLSVEEKSKGVVACSAGNHAQGVARSAQKEKIKCTIFMPSASPLSKIEATKKYGAEVRLVDGVYDDTARAAIDFHKSTGAAFIHPFDDIDVIAGQGTVALEILEQLPDADAVIVPIGGGGLASGIGFVIKQINPKCRVFGVQAQGAASMVNSINEKKITSLKSVSTFADGIAVKTPGEITFDLCSKYLDGVVSVSDDETATAILSLMERQKMIAEGAGAVAIAAAMFNKLPIEGKKTVCILSGGNIDTNILSRVMKRGLLMTGRLSDISVELLDKAGQFNSISAVLAKYGANIIRTKHSYGGENTDINYCEIQLLIETRDHIHLEEIKSALRREGCKVR